MGNLLLRNLRVAFRRLALHPMRTALVQTGLSIGVGALVATLCVVAGTKQRWSEFTESKAETHVTVDGAWVLLEKEQALLVGFMLEFRARIARHDVEGGRLRLFPADPNDQQLATDVEVWLLEQGAPARAKWRAKGSSGAAVQRTIDRIGVFFYVSAGLCLLTGIVGLFAIQKAAADQRRVELAVRRVEGATGADLVAMLLWEAVLVAILGLATGVPGGAMAGWVVVELLEDTGFAFPTVSVSIGAGALGLCAVAFGLLPAAGAIRASPSLTLREA